MIRILQTLLRNTHPARIPIWAVWKHPAGCRKKKGGGMIVWLEHFTLQHFVTGSNSSCVVHMLIHGKRLASMRCWLMAQPGQNVSKL